jgi:glycosyltransferase involved in cell wall biosynthesis
LLPGVEHIKIAKLKISIIIPAFNEEKLITASLRSIKKAISAFEQVSWDWELIVCNNNSSDRTEQLAAAEGAKVVFEPVNQIARARNTGAAAATGDWLLFIDADSHPSADLLADVVTAIQSGKVLAGGSTVTMDGNYPLSRPIITLWNCLSRSLSWMAGSFIFCEARAFREVGGFSKELYASEELDLSKRLKKVARERGKRVVILTRHPLVTSGRKMELYTAREHFVFLARTVLSLGRTLRSSKRCPTWYDGRR